MNNSSNSATQHFHLHPNVKASLINPKGSMEIRGWLKNHKDIACGWVGDDGETMMHWAFLSDWILACELRDAGLSFSDIDKYNRSPMDWLNDRLWGAIVDPSTSQKLSTGAKERLRKHSEEQIQALWTQGARPSISTQSIHPGVVWIRSGAWVLLPLLEQDENSELLVSKDGYTSSINQLSQSSKWLHWTPQGGSALHAWVLSPNTPSRRNFLNMWISKDASPVTSHHDKDGRPYLQMWTPKGLDVDVRDNDGRTPLWYAVDAWLASPAWRQSLIVVIKELLAVGASCYADDIDGATPISLVEQERLAMSKEYQDLLFVLDPK